VVKTLKMRQTGGSVSATIPKEMAERFQMEAGDEVFAVETEAGILLTPYDPVFAKAMRVYERGARKYRNALRTLAK
jgi:putative addiction module antidote